MLCGKQRSVQILDPADAPEVLEGHWFMKLMTRVGVIMIYAGYNLMYAVSYRFQNRKRMHYACVIIPGQQRPKSDLNTYWNTQHVDEMCFYGRARWWIHHEAITGRFGFIFNAEARGSVPGPFWLNQDAWGFHSAVEQNLRRPINIGRKLKGSGANHGH